MGGKGASFRMPSDGLGLLSGGGTPGAVTDGNSGTSNWKDFEAVGNECFLLAYVLHIFDSRRYYYI